MLNNFVKNTSKLGVIFLLILVICTLAAIFYLNDAYGPTKSDLKGFAGLKKEAIALQKDSKIGKDNNYIKLLHLISRLEIEKLSRDEQFDMLDNASLYVDFAYANTNVHELYNFRKDLDALIRENFPQKKWSSKDPQCMDSTCADTSQPKVILDIISEIKQSTVPTVLKEEIAQELITFGYINKKDSLAKVYDYLFVAEDIRHNRDFTNAGLNIKISDEIINYVKNTFPLEYSKIQTVPKE